MAIIEYAKNICSLKEATSSEFNKIIKEPIIKERSLNKNDHNPNNNIRIGNHKCLIKKGTLTSQLYKSNHCFERHRNKYEFNLRYKQILEENGLTMAGYNEKTNLIEIIELSNHPYFIACQFRAEFKSRPIKAHPLFLGLIKAIIDNKK